MTDAIIVLANLMDTNGVLNDESVMRLKMGVDCFKSRNARCMVTSGWAYRPDSEICIGSAMAKFLNVELGMPEARILVDLSARDTVGDALFTKMNVVMPNEWSSFIVVTSDYHLQRTKDIFSFIYGPGFQIEVFGIKTTPTADQIANEFASLEAFRKTFCDVKPGDTHSIARKLIQCHPYYNGLIFPKIQVG